VPATGVSRFLVADVRVRYWVNRVNRQWSAAAGIDNRGDQTYRAFDPYAQRQFSAELRYDL